MTDSSHYYVKTGSRTIRISPAPIPGAALAVAAATCWLSMQSDPTQAQPTIGMAPQTIQVGPSRTVKTIADAARRARPGALIEVDTGQYNADVAVWTQDGLTLRAMGGRVRLNAAGAAAEGKAIWVVRAARITVEGFEFSGAKVPERNGAGIRLEQGRSSCATVRSSTTRTAS